MCFNVSKTTGNNMKKLKVFSWLICLSLLSSCTKNDTLSPGLSAKESSSEAKHDPIKVQVALNKADLVGHVDLPNTLPNTLPPPYPPPVVVLPGEEIFLSCGDGERDEDEQCDDGNKKSGDGCSEFCRFEVCGNKILDKNESCDDGNTSNGDGCSSACLFECNQSDTCTDNNACTQTDICTNGLCIGSNPVVCTALDQCHDLGTCDNGTGQCSNPLKVDGTVCDDANANTVNDVCTMGVCLGIIP